MKPLELKTVLFLIIVTLLFACTSVPRLQEKTPKTFIEAYFQRWNSGLKEGGSGVNVYINMKDDSIVLDSIYFRGRATKLQRRHDDVSNYIGSFMFRNNTEEEVDTKTSIPFELKDNECVISYTTESKTRYFKLSNLKEKEILNYPSSPSKQ